ncbi:MAG: DUF547 domain-containing protein [Gammaproteobacteria bacterium]
MPKMRFPHMLGLVLFMLLPLAADAADSRVLNALLDGVLAAHVKDGYVDYPEIARNVRFHKYLEAIAEFDVDALADDKERLAFWINAYNALAIKQIIDGQTPIGTIARMKFFRLTSHRVGQRNLDLNAIENDILLAMDEPRVHFAIVNATYSAPNLRSGAYRVDELDRQLEDNTRNFVQDVRKNRFSRSLRLAKLSEIFDGHRDAFGGDDKAVQEFISRYVDDDEVAADLAAGRYAIEYLEIDWSINGHPM